jgi:hypothetical protein
MKIGDLSRITTGGEVGGGQRGSRVAGWRHGRRRADLARQLAAGGNTPRHAWQHMARMRLLGMEFGS